MTFAIVLDPPTRSENALSDELRAVSFFEGGPCDGGKERDRFDTPADCCKELDNSTAARLGFKEPNSCAADSR